MDFSPPRALVGLSLAFLAAILLVAGCDNSGIGRTVTVSGKVTLGGQALDSGMVQFIPDKEGGNNSPVTSVGPIKADGTYTLTTGGKSGAPLGKFKVVVMPGMPADLPANPGGKPRHVP